MLSALVSGTCCWHLRVLPTQERGDGHHPDAVPDSGSDWGSQRERGGGLRSIPEGLWEWVARGQIEGNWESGTAIIGDRMSRGGAVLRGMEFSWCRDPEALMFSLINPLVAGPLHHLLWTVVTQHLIPPPSRTCCALSLTCRCAPSSPPQGPEGI